MGSVGGAYREEDRYDEAKGRANDLDMARVLVLKVRLAYARAV